MSKLAVYFSQSWRPRDVDLNVRVWSEFSPTCELLVDEAEDPSAEPPYYINRIEELCREDGVVVHHYGKTEARPGRKMGHFTRLMARQD